MTQRAPDVDSLVATARELGRTRFAERAARYDLEASFPHENYQDLAEAGFLGLCIPTRYGGLGADFEGYCRVAAEIGRHCGATALTFNMHSLSMLWSSGICDVLTFDESERVGHEARRAHWYERVLKEHLIFAQPFSEPDGDPFATTARPVADGWLVNGRKHFASLSGAASHYAVTCTEVDVEAEPGTPGDRQNLFLVVDGDSDGFAITGTWDPLGMRGTVSRQLEFQDVFVPAINQLLPRGAYLQAARRWPAVFFSISAPYVGIARAAFDFTVAYLKGEYGGGERLGPAKQHGVARMRLMLDQAEALWESVIANAGCDPTTEQRLRLFSAHYSVMEHCNDICQLAVRTCGGRSILRSLPLERMYRDSRCGSLMLPYTAEICLERLGYESLHR